MYARREAKSSRRLLNLKSASSSAEDEQLGYPPADIDFSFYERILERLLPELCFPEHAATLWTGRRAKGVDAVDAGFAPD